MLFLLSLLYRLSTVTNSDVIIVLDKGQIVERGTHAELMEKGETGMYYQLRKQQQVNDAEEEMEESGSSVDKMEEVCVTLSSWLIRTQQLCRLIWRKDQRVSVAGLAHAVVQSLCEDARRV